MGLALEKKLCNLFRHLFAHEALTSGTSVNNVVRAHVLVEGRVQGVAYRAFACETADQSGLTGWVQNLPDGRVELEVEGSQHAIDQFLSTLRQGPALARVDQLHVDWLNPTGRDSGFHIRH